MNKRQLGGQSGYSRFVESRSFPSTCVPSSSAPVVVCVSCICSFPCRQSPIGKIVGCAVAGCKCVCVAGSTGRGSQKGTAREVETKCLLGGGII